MLSFLNGMPFLHIGLSKIYFSFNASIVFCLQSSLKPTMVLSYALSDELHSCLFLSHSFILPCEKFSATVPSTSNWMLLEEKELRGGGGTGPMSSRVTGRSGKHGGQGDIYVCTPQKKSKLKSQDKYLGAIFPSFISLVMLGLSCIRS